MISSQDRRDCHHRRQRCCDEERQIEVWLERIDGGEGGLKWQGKQKTRHNLGSGLGDAEFAQLL